MNPAKALQAALTEDRARQMSDVLNEVIRRYGVDAWHSNLANLWWGWRMEWKPNSYSLMMWGRP